MLLCSISVYAQDVIVKKNGSTVLCRIVEVNSTEIVYKKWSDLKGANYIMERTDATYINYENGKKDILSNPGINQFAPGNQNQGSQQMNDNALLNMTNAAEYIKKAKNHKIIGWTGGILLVGVGATFIALDENRDDGAFVIPGISCIVGGAIWTGTCLYTAKRYIKRANSMVLNTPVWQNDFKLKEGKSLMAGIDLLKENTHQTHNLGIAFRYNF